VEAKSASDATSVARIYQANTSGVAVVGAASEPLRDTNSHSNVAHFYSSSAANGYLLHLTDPIPAAASPGVLGSRNVSGKPSTFLGMSTNVSLEAYSAFSNTGCPNSEIALARSVSTTQGFAGIMRVLGTNPLSLAKECVLRFFKNTTGANVSVFPLNLTVPSFVLMSRVDGVQPFVHLDSLDRTTILWLRGQGSVLGSLDAAIEITTVSANNTISSTVPIVQSSPSFGQILTTSLAYTQNPNGVGALAFLVREPNAPFLVYGVYTAKYQPGAGFSAPTRVAMPANTLVESLATAVNAAGEATVMAVGQTCTTLTATTSSMSCAGGNQASFTYQF
jgi:hypothetical protein